MTPELLKEKIGQWKISSGKISLTGSPARATSSLSGYLVDYVLTKIDRLVNKDNMTVLVVDVKNLLAD